MWKSYCFVQFPYLLRLTLTAGSQANLFSLSFFSAACLPECHVMWAEIIFISSTLGLYLLVKYLSKKGIAGMQGCYHKTTSNQFAQLLSLGIVI